MEESLAGIGMHIFFKMAKSQVILFQTDIQMAKSSRFYVRMAKFRLPFTFSKSTIVPHHFEQFERMI